MGGRANRGDGKGIRKRYLFFRKKKQRRGEGRGRAGKEGRMGGGNWKGD